MPGGGGVGAVLPAPDSVHRVAVSGGWLAVQRAGGGRGIFHRETGEPRNAKAGTPVFREPAISTMALPISGLFFPIGRYDMNIYQYHIGHIERR